VAPFSASLTLGTPQVLRARNAREFRDLEANAGAVPVPGRQFSRTERLLIRVPVYGRSGDPVVTAKLVTALGHIMRDVPVKSVPGSDVREIDLPLSGLPTAEYRVNLTAASGLARAQDSLTFRVTP